MNKRELKKFHNTTLKKRKQYVISAEHDVQFAKDQIVFWKKHLKDCNSYLKNAQKAVADWEKRMQS